MKHPPLNIATFPISGPKLDPSRDEYREEGYRLAAESKRCEMRGDYQSARELLNKADGFHRVYHRKGWAPKIQNPWGHAS